MPVFGVFALAICSSYYFGVSSGLAIGMALFTWGLIALFTGLPIVAIACVIAAANLGWIFGLWLQFQHRPELAD